MLGSGGEAEGTEAEESLPQDPRRNKGSSSREKKQGVQGPAQLQQPDHSAAAPLFRHEENQEEKAEATEVKKKEGKRGRIHLNFDFPVFFFHRG